VNALKKMSAALEGDLQSMLRYFGETPESPEAPKYEDFFSMICSFSSALQKAVLEVHDAEAKMLPAPMSLTLEAPSTEEDGRSATPVCYSTLLEFVSSPHSFSMQIPRHGKEVSEASTLKPPSMGKAAGLSINRGEFDQAIRSMRDGRRRARPNRERPLSKIFLDGGNRQSRIMD
jgi:diaphanous 1